MLFDKPVPLNLITCGSCGGKGYLGYKKCPNCHSYSIGRMKDGEFLYFGFPLTHYYIELRKARRILNKFRIIGGFVFGFGFLAVSLILIYFGEDPKDVITLDYWTTAGTAQMLFWLSIISFSYLIYRLLEKTKQKIVIEYHEDNKKEKIQEMDEPVLQTWTEVDKISRKKKIDISAVFDDEAKNVVEESYRIAKGKKSEVISIYHFFESLLSADSIGTIFIRLGLPVQIIKARLDQVAPATKETSKEPDISDDVVQAIFYAYEKAKESHQDFVHATELLISIVNQSDVLQELLYDLNIDKQKLTNVVEWVRIRQRLYRQYQKMQRAGAYRSKHGMDRAMTAVVTPYLNSFSQDITLAAKYGNLASCVARDKEIDEIFRIIQGGRQSVLLVGDHGVGKMSILEGIAERMVEGRVPKELKEKRLVQISTSALLAGTTASGAQERILRIMNEVARARNIILVISNLEDLVGISSEEGGGGLDISEALGQYLGPGKFLTLATATPEGYNKHITNTQIGTVFSRVDIREMDKNQAIQVLESKAGSIEYRQKIFFSYDAIESAVKFAGSLMHDQKLPESAIEIITESASYVKNSRGESQLVEANDVAHVISEKTGVPVTNITEDESSKLLRLEEEMHERIIGQDEAVVLVANALRRARAEIRSSSRPIANFLFLGPTGVGKTELAKTIADVYFGGENRMVRVDMSEYQDQSSIYRLIGQPGQKGTGILTEAIRQQPFSLLLLDELEKADPNVLNLFLQVFDDGRLTDSVGRVIDFTNTIIIATSNAATDYVQSQIQEGTALEEIRQTLIRGKLKEYYKPEFLNRFDGIVLFRALVREEIKKIAGLMLKRVTKDLEARGVEFRVEDSALEALAMIGFDPEFGARPMRRAIQDKVENQLAELVLGNKLKRRDVVVLGEGAEMSVIHST
ncbi:AAA family ATPase [Patescibacteria group bacterium]|nr:AAA family ATPase [Patescibacteria group bacterium]MBU1895721.1 AAA family ATPase [Patescibacteria group bacterium]